MAPKKRATRTVKDTSNNDFSNLTLSNVLCPICRSIFIEPVTLPCNHGFCLNCFEGTVANANLTCPLCRVRFGSWHRIAKKENRIINALLWNAVQKNFPEQVKNRLAGVEENLDEEPQTIIRVASPGAIRREYELQRQLEQERLEKEREVAEKASELLIKKLREQEEFEETVREEKLRLDENLAKQISKEINVVKPDEKPNSKIVNKGSSSNKNNTLDNFFSKKQKSVQILLEPVGVESNSSGNSNHFKSKCLSDFPSSNPNKTDSVRNGENMYSSSAVNENEIDRECKYFKPIEPAKSTFKITPVKVPVKNKRISSTTNIRSPKGKKDFIYRASNSPFVYFKPSKQFQLIDLSYQEIINNKRKPLTRTSIQQKRPLQHVEAHLSKIVNPVCNTIFPPIKRQCIENIVQGTKNSIKKPIDPSKSFNIGASCSTWDRSRSGSPFCGFPTNNKKEIQEKEDREFAMKLHEQLNCKTRLNSIKSIDLRKQKRQAKLEELVKPINIAK